MSLQNIFMNMKAVAILAALSFCLPSLAQEPDMLSDEYYKWAEKTRVELSKGVVYSHYSWENVPRNMHVLEVDLTRRNIEILPVVANDIIPNPNGNRNKLNGFCIRETLSGICTRYNETLGQSILAGINACGFDSHIGYARGIIVSGGEPIYQNYPQVRQKYGYPHSWCFTVFKDRTAAVGQKEFYGGIRIGKEEIEYHAINDYILRGDDVGSPVNIYTSRYKEVPHEGRDLVNHLLDSAVVYVVAKYTRGPMKVNCGYSKAKVMAIHDGRTEALEKAPYLDSDDQVGIQLRGEAADKVMRSLKVGDRIALKADMTVGGVRKPVMAMVNTLHRFLHEGVDKSSENLKPKDSNLTTHNPMTFAAVSRDGRKIWLVEVDGRSSVSKGLKSVEMAQISLRLGGYEMTRFDGGGSSAMWVRDCGGLVSVPSDKRGERSCLNYILVRKNR
jgi:exopolysaccharide biosynthesis protein